MKGLRQVGAERMAFAPVNGPLEFLERITNTSADVRELYDFAARRPDVLDYVAPAYRPAGQ